MNISEMTNEQLIKNYICLLKEIDTNYQAKKEFEQEMKERFNLGKM